MALSSENIFVSIDVGTTKICVLIAERVVADNLEILGVGIAPSDGLSKGVVVDITKTIESIKQAVKEAELMAGFEIESAIVGVSGAHIAAINSHGVVPIKKGEVRAGDVSAVIASAQAISLAEGQQILHVLPQYFMVDGQMLKDPLGMHGVRLEVQVHIITGAVACVQNVVKCCQLAGVKISDIVLEPLASSSAVLSDDERELGVGIVDIGGGTSDFAVYQQGAIRHTMVIPVAGNHFTNDIAVGLATTLREAERIKREYGTTSLLKRDERIEIDMVHCQGKKTVLTHQLTDILRPRAQELLMLVQKEIESCQLLPFMRAGFVLTGGGSLLRGIDLLAEEIFKITVRVGAPAASYSLPASLNSPQYATAYGLLVYVVKKHQKRLPNNHGPLMSRVFDSMRSWIVDFF